jgi:hypothetical protein
VKHPRGMLLVHLYAGSQPKQHRESQ